MKKYVYLLLVTLLLGACATQKQETPAPYSQRMVESHGLADFYCNRHHQSIQNRNTNHYGDQYPRNVFLRIIHLLSSNWQEGEASK